MSEVIKFEPKKSVNERLKEHLSESEQALRSVIKNEMITRQRVENMERMLGAFFSLPLRFRLKWVLFGMPKIPKAPEPIPEVPSDVH